jgi:hypothetical protein
MDDKIFYYKLLGLHPPWLITNVNLNEAEQRVDIYLDHERHQSKMPEWIVSCDHSPKEFTASDTRQMATYIRSTPG